MNILGVIPARAGSKRLKNKNILPIRGKPMILHALGHARKSRLVDRIVCSTDSPRIAKIMERSSCEVIRRPKRLARDRSRLEDALRHAALYMERKRGFRADIIVVILANIPVRSDGVIDRVIERLIATGADSVFTVEPVGKFNPCWMVQLGKDNRMHYYEPSPVFRAQDLPPVYINNGAAMAVRREVLLRKTDAGTNYAAYGKDIRLVVQKRYDAIDVDDIFDFEMAKIALKAKKRERRS